MYCKSTFGTLDVLESLPKYVGIFFGNLYFQVDLQGKITYPTKREVWKLVDSKVLGGDMFLSRRVYCIMISFDLNLPSEGIRTK